MLLLFGGRAGARTRGSQPASDAPAVASLVSPLVAPFQQTAAACGNQQARLSLQSSIKPSGTQALTDPSRQPAAYGLRGCTAHACSSTHWSRLLGHLGRQLALGGGGAHARGGALALPQAGRRAKKADTACKALMVSGCAPTSEREASVVSKWASRENPSLACVYSTVPGPSTVA